MSLNGIDGALSRAIAASLGVELATAQRVSGGSINEAYRVELEDRTTVFVKYHASCDPAMFAAEAKGLSWLREADALRVPDVIAVSGPGRPSFIVLEHLSPGRRAGDFWDSLGRGLAALHRFGADGFGFESDNFIGSLPQVNRPGASWPEFYWTRRLQPQLDAASSRGYFSSSDHALFARLEARLQDLCGPEEPPARLHGDLWAGNLHVGPGGEPCLIDPAVYGGHREVDLAMMELFGGFDSRAFDAYDEAWPLAPGWRERLPLYQLYYLLVHVNLFGRGYVSQARAALSNYV